MDHALVGPARGQLPRVSTLIGTTAAPYRSRYFAASEMGGLKGLAFYHERSDVYNSSYVPPRKWSAPGKLLRRPPCAYVACSVPSISYGQLSLDPFIVQPDSARRIATASDPYLASLADIPGTVPAEFMLGRTDNSTANWYYQPTANFPNTFNSAGIVTTRNPLVGSLMAPVTPPFRPDVYSYAVPYSTMPGYAVPLPHPWAGPTTGFDIDALDLPVTTSDFLFIHVGSWYNAWNRLNTEDLIADRRRFPDYACRFYLPSLDDLATAFSRMPAGPDFTASNADALRFTAGWRDAIEDGCDRLRAAGIDALVVGEEKDATRAAIGRLISDHFGFARP